MTNADYGQSDQTQQPVTAPGRSGRMSPEKSLDSIFPGKKWVDSVLSALETKEDMTTAIVHRYLMRAAMAGMIIAVLYVVNYEITGIFSTIKVGETALTGVGKMIGAFCFGWALVFIYYTRSELLTSNMMLVVTGVYFKRTTWARGMKVLTICFLGNFVGGVILAILFSGSTLTHGVTGEVMVHSVETKIAYVYTASGLLDLLVRAILCNFMINLAMLLIYNGLIQETVAKMASMVMAVFIFAFLGFEHSVANSVLFAVVGLSEGIDVLGAVANIVVVLIGNFIGGGLMIGLYYAYMEDRDRGTRRRERAEARAEARRMRREGRKPGNTN
ncbi:MAG: formate/nitrite transporter family protein [Corynebacterium sp.]|nr:formate/nitrite transporter family protein [Corynebacterium sp.]